MRMKKTLLTLVIIMAISTVSTPVATVEEAHAAPIGGLGCTTAADFGWENWNWNQICYYEMVMIDPGIDGTTDWWNNYDWN